MSIAVAVLAALLAGVGGWLLASGLTAWSRSGRVRDLLLGMLGLATIAAMLLLSFTVSAR